MYYTPNNFIKYKNIITVSIFNQNIGPIREFKKEVIKMRRKIFKKLGIDINNVVLQDQQHTANIKIIGAKDRGRRVFSFNMAIRNNDGMITDCENVFLGVYTADCVPVLFYDPIKKVCGAAHCGWRGILKQLSAKMIKKFVQSFGSDPRDIVCWLGPSIHKCCYDVSKASDDRVRKFMQKFGSKSVRKMGKKLYLDLQYSILHQLKKCDINSRNIEVSPVCTCHDRRGLPSYYRDRKLEKSILTLIGMKMN